LFDKLGPQGLGMVCFKEFLDQEPAALQLFPFKDEWPLHESDLFKKFSVDFVKGLDTAVLMLSVENKLISYLRTLGKDMAGKATP
jgi:hypothetical protein